MKKLILLNFITVFLSFNVLANDMPNFMRAASCCQMDGDQNACMVVELMKERNVIKLNCKKGCDDKLEKVEEQITAAAKEAEPNCNKPLY